MPEVISNEIGNLMLSEDKAIFVPGSSEQHRRVADKYIAEKYGDGAWGINHPVDAWYFADGTPNYGPMVVALDTYLCAPHDHGGRHDHTGRT